MNDFPSDIAALVGRSVVGYTGGPGSGSVVNFKFGNDIGSALPFPRRPTGDVSPFGELLVECVWRVEDAEQVLCGAWDENEEPTPKFRTLDRLVKSAVVKVELTSPAYDLSIHFACGLTLRVFCDRVNEVDAYDNYSFHLPAGVWVVHMKSRLEWLPAIRRA